MWILFSRNLVLFKFILSYGLSKSSPTLLKKDIIATPNKPKLTLPIKSWIRKLCSWKYGYIMFHVSMHPTSEWNEELTCQRIQSNPKRLFGYSIKAPLICN